MTAESEVQAPAEGPPMRRVDLGDGNISVSIDPRHDPEVQKKIRSQALTIVAVSFVILAVVFVVPLVVHFFRIQLP